MIFIMPHKIQNVTIEEYLQYRAEDHDQSSCEPRSLLIQRFRLIQFTLFCYAFNCIQTIYNITLKALGILDVQSMIHTL